MPLAREPEPKKPEREKHKCVPIHGEFGRYMVDSRSAAKKGREEAYVVDVLATEETNAGTITGTCSCKGWQVRKVCSHVLDAKEEHIRLVTELADQMGFDDSVPE